MPQYLDHHPTNPDMPPELVEHITQRLDSGQPDEFGQVGLHVFIGPERTYCHTEAPTVEAVLQVAQGARNRPRPSDRGRGAGPALAPESHEALFESSSAVQRLRRG